MVRTGDQLPLDLFRQGIRAEATRYRYTMTLRQVLCNFLGDDMLTGGFEERVKQLVQYGRDDPEWVRDLLLILSKKMRERTELPRDDPDYLNPTSISGYFKPIKKLFDMNDVVINWKRIYATYPEPDNVFGSAGWTREEIATMLKHTRDTQDRALILVLASSGVRAGALDYLNWGDLTPVYRVGEKLTLDHGEESGEVACAMLEVYRGSVENYTAFVTPEAFAALRDYGRSWAEAMGRQAKDGDPIFLREVGMPARATYTAVQKRLNRVVKRAGLRGDLGGDRRHRVPLMNGFRRFFNKTCKDVLSGDTLGSLIRAEYMMGHRGLTSLDQNYFKTTPLELAAKYVAAVPDLTIDDADRLRLSNRRMSDNVRRLEGERDEVLARLEAKISEMESAAKEKDEKVARLMRERDEAVARGGSENNEKVTRMEAEMVRMREEVAEVRRQGKLPVSDILTILRESSETDGVPGKFLKSLTGMMGQLREVQEANLKEIRAEYEANLKEIRAEYEAKTNGLQRTAGNMAKEDHPKDEPQDGNPPHNDPRDSGLR